MKSIFGPFLKFGQAIVDVSDAAQNRFVPRRDSSSFRGFGKQISNVSASKFSTVIEMKSNTR
jgi:hypothetical protein